MKEDHTVNDLIDALLDDMPWARDWAAGYGKDPASPRRLLRGLMNRRPPLPLKDAFLRQQDALLAAERNARGTVSLEDLTPCHDPSLYIWQGDITRLAVDGIVNAANERMLGCFVPEHACIDNAIHSAAGLQLRADCDALMTAQGHPEPTGQAKITPGYNLPARYVLHTVGPIVDGPLRESHRHALADSYRSCLQLAHAHGLRHLAFCCISTGVFHFPNAEAAKIAVDTVNTTRTALDSPIAVIFNVFTDEDRRLYEALLCEA